MHAESEVKTTFWLEMTDANQFRPKSPGSDELEVRRVELPCGEYSWFLHQAVGADFRWGGRQEWGRAEWDAFVRRPGLETWVGYVRGTPAGYYELERQGDGSVRVLAFGLRGAFFGRGLGGHLLTACVERAWELGANRVWLTTCSHDHPRALPGYMARGFRQFQQTTGPPNPQRASALFARA